MFSPYFSNHSDLFILKWSTLTTKKHRLHFPKYEIKFLSSQSSANYWRYKSDLNQWILALLVSFQALTQGPEKDSSFSWVFSPDLGASPSHSGRGGFCRAGGQMVMVSEMCLCLTHQMGTQHSSGVSSLYCPATVDQGNSCEQPSLSKNVTVAPTPISWWKTSKLHRQANKAKQTCDSELQQTFWHKAVYLTHLEMMRCCSELSHLHSERISSPLVRSVLCAEVLH